MTNQVTRRARRSDALYEDHSGAWGRRALCDRIALLELPDPAPRVIVADSETDCATGYCRCGNCGTSIDQWDAYCRHCGARLEDR